MCKRGRAGEGRGGGWGGDWWRGVGGWCGDMREVLRREIGVEVGEKWMGLRKRKNKKDGGCGGWRDGLKCLSGWW